MPSTGTRPSRAAWRGGRGRPGHKGDHKQGEEGPEMVCPPPARQRAKKVDANPDVSPSSRPDEPPRGKGTGAALRAASSHDDVVSPPSSTVPNHSVQPPRPRYSMDQVLRHLDTASTQPAHQGKRRHVQDTPPTVQQVIPPPSPVSSHDEVYTPRIPFQSLVDSHASAVDTGAPRYLPSSRSRTPVLPSRPQTWRQEMEFRLAAIMAPPPYSDDEVPLPKPYNAEYPHPISSYASHGCNAYVRRTSGYDLILQHLIDHDPDQLKGSILASANRDDIFPPSLTMLVEAGEGCSIPERLWTRFESFGAARVPIGIGASASYAPSLTSQLPSPSTPSTSYSTPFRPAAHVDHAPTTQYHSSSSHDSWHTPSVPPRFARSLSQSSSTTSLRQVGTASTCPSPSPFTREVDSYTYPLKSVYDEWSSLKKGSDPSPFFKTEMCQIWEDTGLCKYGTSCQFAHGLHELRNLPGLTALPTPPLDHTALPTEGFVPYRDTPSAYHGRYQQPADSTTLSEQYQYPRKSSVDSLTTPFYHTPSLSMSSRFEGRRASAPPSHLAPVLEVVDDDLPTPWWRENFARKQSLAPIGSERESSHGSNSNGSPPRHGDRERGIHGMTPSPSRGSKQYDQSPSQASMSSSSRYTRPDSAYGWTNTASTALETMATGPSTGATQSRGWIDEPITRLPKGTRAPITPETYLQASTPSPSKSAQRSNGAQGQDIFATTFDFPQSRSIWS